MPQINQYANTAASITDADWLDLDKNTGVGTFQSQKLRLSTLGAGLINVLPILGQNIYNHDDTITGTRTVGLGGNTLKFSSVGGGQVQMGNFDVGSSVWNLVLATNGGGGAPVNGALFACFGSGTALSLTSSTGTALKAGSGNPSSTTTKAAEFTDRVQIIEEGVTPPAVVPELLLDIQSNKKGVRFPELTTAERDTNLASAPNYTEINNTILQRHEFKHPIFGWVGMSENSVTIQSLSSTLGVGTFYAGCIPTKITATLAERSFTSPYNGKITKVHLRTVYLTAGDRSISVYIRVNDMTDYLVQTITNISANREFINLAMNTTGIPITTSDTIVVKIVSSGGTLDATGFISGGTITIQ